MNKSSDVDGGSSCKKCSLNNWLGGILAVAELILGFVMLSFPLLLGTAAVWVCGVALLLLAIVHFWHVLSRAGERLWNLVSGLVYVVLGLGMVFMPLASMELITLILGIVLLSAGLFRLTVAISLRREVGAAWRFFNGIVSLVLGGIIIWTWPISSLWFIGTIIAIEMIFSGWSLLFMALVPESSDAA